MSSSGVRVAAALLAIAAISAPVSAQDPQPSAAAAPVVRSIEVSGAHQLGERESIDAMHVRVGEPLPATPERLAQSVERHYRDEGYTFAKASVAFDESRGALDVTIDEGVIDTVEFEGIPEQLARRIADDFAVRAGDVFNRRRALDALNVALLPTRGAVATAGVATDADSGEPRRRTFTFVERNGQHVLVVALRQRNGRFRLAPDFGDREDWFTPVDGLVPSLGFGAVAFDHERFEPHLRCRTPLAQAGEERRRLGDRLRAAYLLHSAAVSGRRVPRPHVIGRYVAGDVHRGERRRHRRAQKLP